MWFDGLFKLFLFFFDLKAKHQLFIEITIFWLCILKFSLPILLLQVERNRIKIKYLWFEQALNLKLFAKRFFIQDYILTL